MKINDARAVARTSLRARLDVEGETFGDVPCALGVEGAPLLARTAGRHDGRDASVHVRADGVGITFAGTLRATLDAHDLARLRALHGESVQAASRIELEEVRWQTDGGETSAAAGDWLLPTPEWRDGEAGVLEHMNDDHVDAMERMCRVLRGIETSAPSLVAVDPEGLVVRTGSGLVHFAFEKPAETMHDVHVATVALARQARAAEES